MRCGIFSGRAGWIRGSTGSRMGPRWRRWRLPTPTGDKPQQQELTEAQSGDHKLHLPEQLAPLEQILNQLPGIDKIADLLNMHEQTHELSQDLPVVNPLAIVNEMMAPMIDPERTDRAAQNPLAESANLNILGDKIEEIIVGSIHNTTPAHQDATLLSSISLLKHCATTIVVQLIHNS